MIQSVQRAAQILEALASGTPSTGLGEIAERVGLPKPTVHGLLRTLERNNLVSQNPDTGKYSLGPAVLQLGNAYLGGSELRARSMLRAGVLARDVNESVWVAVLADYEIMVVHHEFRPDDAVQVLEVGASIPWYACALGMAIAAHQETATLEHLLSGPMRQLTGRTRTTRTAILSALDKVRRDGYAVENQEATVGDAGLAAPVFDSRGRAIGALGVVGPSERLLVARTKQKLARSVRETARAVSRDLGAARLPSGELVG